MTWVKPWNLGSNLKIGCEMRFEPLFWHFFFCLGTLEGLVWNFFLPLFFCLGTLEELVWCFFGPTFFVWAHLRDSFETCFTFFSFFWAHLRDLFETCFDILFLFGHTWRTSWIFLQRHLLSPGRFERLLKPCTFEHF